MAVRPVLHTQYRFGVFLLMSAFMRLVWGGLDWLFLLINWTKRKVLKEKALLYSMSSFDAVYDVFQFLRRSNLQLCQLLKHKKFSEHELYKHIKKSARVFDDYSKKIEPYCSTTNTGSGTLPNSPTDEMPPVKWNSDPQIFQQNMEEYEKKNTEKMFMRN